MAKDVAQTGHKPVFIDERLAVPELDNEYRWFHDFAFTEAG